MDLGFPKKPLRSAPSGGVGLRRVWSGPVAPGVAPCRVVEATPDRPLLTLILDGDQSMLSQLLIDIDDGLQIHPDGSSDRC